jgi:hypothetical protein
MRATIFADSKESAPRTKVRGFHLFALNPYLKHALDSSSSYQHGTTIYV